MKFVIFFTLIALAVQASYAQSHDYVWGIRETGDRQLFREIVQKHPSFLQNVYKDVSYSGSSRITYIKITDQYIHGNAGYASLLAGGVGSTDVTIRLKSQKSHGFKFIVEIYGL